MRRTERLRGVSAVLSVLAIVCVSAAHGASPRESVVVAESGESFEITVPVSRLVLQLPKAGFTRSTPAAAEGSMANPRYFLFQDKARGIRLSG